MELSIFILLLAMVIFPLLFISCYKIGNLLIGKESPLSIKLSSGVIIFNWILILLFFILSPVYLFRFQIVFSILLIISIIILLRLPKNLSSENLLIDISFVKSCLKNAVNSVHYPGWRVVLIILLVILVVKVFQGLIMPPVFHDTLTYHLFKAGRWIQSGGSAIEFAPDASGYYEYFPPAGDVLWAYAMMPTGNDMLLIIPGLLILFTVLLGIYAAGRAIRASAEFSILAALMVIFLPPVGNLISSYYVDSTALAFFILSVALLFYAFHSNKKYPALLSVASMGLAAAVKSSFLPVLLFLIIFLLICRIIEDGLSVKLLKYAVLILFASAAALPHYAEMYMDKGSPLYPLSFNMFGKTILHGDTELVNVLQGNFGDGESAKLSTSFIINILFFRGLRTLASNWIIFHKTQPINFSFFVLPALIAGISGWILFVVKNKIMRKISIFTAGAIAILLAGIFSNEVKALWTEWGVWSCRFLTPAAAILILMCAKFERYTKPIIYLTIISEIILSLPYGLSKTDASVFSDLSKSIFPMIIVSGSGIYAVIVFIKSRKKSYWAISLIIITFSILSILSIGTLRKEYRYSYYEDIAKVQSGVGAEPGSPFTACQIWKYLDTGEKHTIAISSGLTRTGHHVFRYPLLGSNLQNKVVYISPRKDGMPLNRYMIEKKEYNSDLYTWLRRLADSDADYFVSLYPHPPVESKWIDENPKIFTEIYFEQKTLHKLYFFNRKEAIAYILKGRNRLVRD